ncbi:hypothetical protein K8U54_12860 [Pseudomonas fulva]|uniref:LPO_1073/Vpar_1526 family protein n=1 Tax=Pseudomonas fulva TaxID=47880 RepID=UPI00201E2B18|nr:LPO_1073/Vpar_1526 family protein [Pseudomonas fulva]UQY32634.1 hypothetical protein K8U54_12860 [Pseudomonas fulva]
MLGKQQQDAKDVAVAAQAGRDVTVNYGLKMSDVKELTQIFLEKNLPALRDEAANIARANAASFLNEFAEKLASSGKVSQEAFAQPDAQACFSRALNDGALKGKKIDLGILAEMVVKRLEASDDDLMSLVYEGALEALPRLSAAQVSFLAWVHYMKSVRHNAIYSLEALDNIAAKLMPVFAAGFDLSDANKHYMSSLGLLTINLIADADQLFENLCKNYDFLPKNREEIIAQAPSLGLLITKYGECRIPTIFLSATGQLIGVIAIKKVILGADPKIWIY